MTPTNTPTSKNCTGCYIGGGNEPRTDEGSTTHQLSRYTHTPTSKCEHPNKSVYDDGYWNCSACAIKAINEGLDKLYAVSKNSSEDWEKSVIEMVEEVANRPEPINGFQPYGIFDEAQEKQIYFDGYKDALAMKMITLTLRTKSGETFLPRLLSLIQHIEQTAYTRGKADGMAEEAIGCDEHCKEEYERGKKEGADGEREEIVKMMEYEASFDVRDSSQFGKGCQKANANLIRRVKLRTLTNPKD